MSFASSMCPTASRSLHKIPATTYPTANLLHNCVPGAPSLYAVVADRIDQSAFTSVLAGLFRAWHVVLLAAAAAAAQVPHLEVAVGGRRN